ncbi:hypothetical protein CRE_08945 [Caenorhabditis remanei]|uniref:Uncharacterized protein n=2 Tax=Caenorhabditis remanei TaxID=31234 RepID=E3LIE5_CAERE|nr:hypothetical protein CRE_08945 [Caenorhabditis remanei]
MNVLPLLSLLLVFCFVNGNGTEKPGACERFKLVEDMYAFCTGVESMFIEYSTFFDKNMFGTKETLNLDISDVEHTLKTCDRYTRCPAMNRVNCFLPKMPQVGHVCKKMMLLKSPYANCLRKLQNQTIQSPDLESLVNDFTNYGITKKCLDLKERSTLMEAILQECDKEAQQSFKYNIVDLKSYYDC